MRTNGLLALTLAACFGFVWRGQTDEEANAVVVKYSQTREYASNILDSMLAYEDHLATHCKDVAFASGSQARILEIRPVTLSKAKKIELGAWKTTLDGIACGLKKRYNVQVDFKRGNVTFTYMLPGTSNAGLELQQDTMASLPKVLPVHDGCLIEVLDTELVGAATTTADGKPQRWRENWEVRDCKRLFTVPVLFLPDGSGTSVSIVPEQIREH